jgi:diketogulonate reductase-like aldo/keto reductase
MHRRRLIASLTGAAAATVVGLPPSATPAAWPLTKAIPSTGEGLPVIGMGTWITFNVGNDPALRASRVEVLRTFFAMGGGVIDSSPMYGSSEEVLGHCLARIPEHTGLFSATKIWTPFSGHGREQMAESERLWGLPRLDLQQVHNLVNWDSHLETLLAAKAKGRVRYVGITTSHGLRHEAIAAIMESHPLDFVQLTYNAVDREAEARLLPLAAEKGIAVIANRPFRRGALVERVARHPLPAWAAEFGAVNWPQLLLKFVVAHPAVTCAIPATSRVEHMRENMGAARGPLPDATLRRRIADLVAGL